MKFTSRTLPLVFLFLLVVCNAWSLPTPCGSTGLLYQPTAQTLNSGNICVGLWSDNSEWGQSPATEKDATVIPFSITLGLGSFLETYGSFPNLLFNDEETDSGHGYAILGTKLRLLGKRSSPLQFAVDAQFKRAVSMDPDIDGLTDFLARGIISLKSKRFGIHGWGGMLDKEENLTAVTPIGPFEDITGYGGGIEIYPTDRLRIIVEAESFSEEQLGLEETGEWMAGFQYFISPHLTFNVGYGEGMDGRDTELSPESRILVGFSSCQGIGSYSQVETRPRTEEAIADEEKNEPVKVLKIRTLSPLLSRTEPAEALPATSPQLPSNTDSVADPGIPVVALPQLLATPTKTAVEITVDLDREIIIDPSQNIATSDTYVKEIAKKPAGMMAPESPPINKPTKTKVYRRFLLPEFAFDVDQFTLSPEGSAALSMIAVELKRDNQWFAMRIEGHTDSTGSNRYNDMLSYDRAVEYAMHLVAKIGFDPSRVFVKGFGEDRPITVNNTPEGRSQNRRVELLILVPAD